MDPTLSPPPITLTSEQSLVLTGITSALLSGAPQLKLGGYAGTGKTTLLKFLREELKPHFQISFIAPTGKAAKVLSSKGLYAQTIHSLIYDYAPTSKTFTKRSKLSGTSLLICDEASMVDKTLYTDLVSFGIPILWVGDPGQLEPVGIDIGLMKSPDFLLSTILRQALDNPIIAFAHHIRLGGQTTVRPSLDFKSFQDKDPTKLQRAYRNIFKPKFKDYDQILVGKNTTRYALNYSIRQMMGKTKTLPELDDKLIILKNSYALGVVNGESCTVTSVDASQTIYSITLESGRLIEDIYLNPSIFRRDDPIRYSSNPDTLNCDFGYAITVHKSQGSEWNRVLVIDEAFGDERARWRYTAITRTKEHLTYLI